MERPTSGVGAESLHAGSAPFLVGRIDPLGTVTIAVRKNPLAQGQHDRDREVGRAVVQGRSIHGLTIGPSFVEGKLDPRGGGVGVTPSLGVLVLEFGRDHASHVAKPFEHYVLVVLQGALYLAGEYCERLVKGGVAAAEEFTRGRLGLRRRRSGPARHRHLGAALFEGGLAQSGENLVHDVGARAVIIHLPHLRVRLVARWLGGLAGLRLGHFGRFGRFGRRLQFRVRHLAKRGAGEQFLLGGIRGRGTLSQRFERRIPRGVVRSVDAVEQDVDLFAH